MWRLSSAGNVHSAPNEKRLPLKLSFCRVFRSNDSSFVCYIVFSWVTSAIANMPILTDSTEMSPSKKAKTAPAEDRPVLRFAKLSENATTPTRGSAKAAGYDLYRLVGGFRLVIYLFIYLFT